MRVMQNPPSVCRALWPEMRVIFLEPGKGIKTLARHTYTDEMVIDQFRVYVMDYVHRTLKMFVEDVDESVLVAYVNRKYDLEIEVNPNEKSLRID